MYASLGLNELKVHYNTTYFDLTPAILMQKADFNGAHGSHWHFIGKQCSYLETLTDDLVMRRKS